MRNWDQVSLTTACLPCQLTRRFPEALLMMGAKSLSRQSPFISRVSRLSILEVWCNTLDLSIGTYSVNREGRCYRKQILTRLWRLIVYLSSFSLVYFVQSTDRTTVTIKNLRGRIPCLSCEVAQPRYPHFRSSKRQQDILLLGVWSIIWVDTSYFRSTQHSRTTRPFNRRFELRSTLHDFPHFLSILITLQVSHSLTNQSNLKCMCKDNPPLLKRDRERQLTVNN